jgi:predicted glycosyltransferase
VLLIEMFPFGRRQMRFELLPLLKEARSSSNPPTIVTSLRDVLTGIEKPEKRAWMVRTFEAYFDLLLVHGDPSFLRLEESFAEALQLGRSLRYTGYVAAADRTEGQPAECSPSGEVLISAGGGAVATPLIESALQAHGLCSLKTRPWRLLVGEQAGSPGLAALQARAPKGVTVEPLRPDFPQLLGRAALSVSQAGYNTVMDLLLARKPALLIPFAEEGEGEQSFRTRRLAAKGLAQVLPASDLTPKSLAEAMERAFAAGPPPPAPLNLKGAEKTAETLQKLLL